jgi:hypothetical protein
VDISTLREEFGRSVKALEDKLSEVEKDKLSPEGELEVSYVDAQSLQEELD